MDGIAAATNLFLKAILMPDVGLDFLQRNFNSLTV
jgi:hypothetical protein